MTRQERLETFAKELKTRAESLAPNPNPMHWLTVLLDEVCQLRIDVQDATADIAKGPDTRLFRPDPHDAEF